MEEGKEVNKILEMEKKKKKENEDGRIEMSEEERETNEKTSLLFLWFCGVWQRVQQRQQDQSFKCSSVLAALCVSGLGGSTKFCHPTQHSDSDKKTKIKK